MKRFEEKQGLQRVTILDVAKKAGVSKTTVSRYLGGQDDMFSQDTGEKIRIAIEELGYRPNQMARGLKGNRSYLIGMVVADITNPYYTEILRAAEEVCKKNNYSLMICNTDNDPAKEREYIFRLQSHRIDGLIINTTGKNDEFLKELASDKTPIILLDRKVKELEFDTVSVDNIGATKEIIGYLLEQKFERIALFTQPIKGVSTRTERLNTFCALLNEKGHISASKDIYEINVKDKEQLKTKLKDFLADSQGKKRVIFAGNGVVMLKVALVLQDSGINIPEDVAMAGFDNPEWSEVLASGITAIDQPTREIGITAMELILKRINGDKSAKQCIELPGRLIIRNSTLV